MEQTEASSSNTTAENNGEPSGKELSQVDVAGLVGQLKSTSFREVYRALNKIRSYVRENEGGVARLQEVGGFKYLIKFLGCSNEDILNLTLGVLANCFNRRLSNQELKKEVLKYGITGKVVAILQNVNNDNTQKKVCTLIGNLAQALNLVRELHRANVTLAILPILYNSKNTTVQQAAVKSLRLIWEASRNHVNLIMLKAGAIKAVATLLSSNDEMLVLKVLSALATFTKVCTDAIAEQVRGSGNGYAEILSKMALPIVSVLVYNLSNSPPARVELCRAGVVPSIIKKLEEGKIDSYLITALCQLCWESMARASLRTTPNGFQTLLSVLTNSTAKDLHHKILSAITQFNYDKQSILIMVQAGLIGILVEMLNDFVKRHGTNHQSGVKLWRNGWNPPSECLDDLVRTDWLEETEHISCSLYSPTNLVIRDANNPIMEIKSSFVHIDERNLEETHVDSLILDILTRLAYQNMPLRPLASKVTIATLLDYLVYMWYPHNTSNYTKAIKTLRAVVACKNYYSSLLDDESVLLIHRELCRPKHCGDCQQCSRMSRTGKSLLSGASLAAHSGLGEGEMYYKLSIAADHVKSSVALTVPHIIKRPALLHNLLIGHSTLKTLLDCLDTRIEEAVPSLRELFNTLGIENKQSTVQICEVCNATTEEKKEENVTFVLDDGCKVGANKELLAHNCPVFEAMFRGAFKESQQSIVRLTEMSADCLIHLTRLVDRYCSCRLPTDLDTLLELVTVADRFLLPSLMDSVLGYIVNVALTYKTCHRIYEWGLRVGYTLPATSHIANTAIVYLFTSSMPSHHRIEAVQNILAGECRQHFKHDLTFIVISELQSYCKQNKFRCIVYKLLS